MQNGKKKVLALLLAGCCVLSACGTKTDDTKTAEKGNFVTGTVECKEVYIRAKIAGYLTDIPVEEGQEVKEGDTLCIIEAMKVMNEIKAPCSGKVVRIIPIGAFVELVPGKDGMIHISKLENRRVEKVEDVLNIGDMTWVKVTEIDEKGRVNLSRKDALKELANADKK